ncbi:MAG: hypothetical protein IJW79_00195 [Clostridia bacterium]|nr:hypothetical protein [Clostridia bacterium]
MAIVNSDGSIILSTKVDTSGVSKGLTDVKSKFSVLKGQKATLATLTQAIKDQQFVLNSLNLEYAEFVAKGKLNSKQAQDLKARINDLTAEMKEMQAAATTLGAKSTTAFAQMKSGLMALASYFIGIQTIFAAIRFSGASAEFATQTEASVQRLVDIYGSASDSVGDFIDANARALGMSKAAAASFSSVYGNLFSVWADQATNAELTNRYLSMTAVVASKTGRTVEDVQERVRSGLLGNTEAIEDLGIFVNVKTIEMTDAFQRMANGKSWEQLDAYTQQQIRSMAILEQATAKYGDEVADTSATIRNRYKAAYEDFQNSWGNIVNTVLLPVLETLTQIFDIATKGLNALSGRSGQILENVELQEENTDKTAENIEEQTKNQKELNKELKKATASFDDIEILSANTAENTSGGLDSGLQVLGGDLGGATPDGSAYVEEIDETLTAIMGIVALSLAAVGLILLFTGNIGWGIGFIIAGAATLTVTMASASEFGYDGIIQMLTTIMGVAGGALLAIGIMLLWLGVTTGIAIGMIIAGGALIVSAVAAQAAFAPDDIVAWLSLIMGIAGGALLALGVILCMVGSIPMGVGMIIAGAVSLVSAVALNFDAVVEAIRGPIGAIMAIVSTALIVIGIILICTGVGIPLGIGLILAGAAGLATVVALNWDAIWDAITGTFNAIIDWIKDYGLLVLGILLCLTGVGIPFGVALLVKWAKDGAENGVPLATAIVDKVKEIWNAVKRFWDANIAPIFTGAFWLELAKNCGNGLIGGFEAAINGIIGMFEKMINWIVDGLNKISFDVPDWVPLIGGNKFGFNIPRANFGRLSIPRLAQGAVIPPNREFLAVLGDQKQGTNIEAPLSTIQEAVSSVVSAQNEAMLGTLEQILEAILGIEIGDEVIGRASQRYNNSMIKMYGG